MHENIPNNSRLLVTLALAVGTILTSFSVTFNNHTMAAALIFAAFCDARARKGFRTGIWISLALCIDVVPGALFIPVFAIIMFYEGGRKNLIRYLGSVFLGGILFLSLDWLIIGNQLPPKLVPGAIDQSSQFNAVIKSVSSPKNWLYPFQCLFGWHGFFTVSPVLIFGAIGLVLAVKKREPLRRRNTVVVGIAVLVMITGYALFVGSL